MPSLLSGRYSAVKVRKILYVNPQGAPGLLDAGEDARGRSRGRRSAGGLTARQNAAGRARYAESRTAARRAGGARFQDPSRRLAGGVGAIATSANGNRRSAAALRCPRDSGQGIKSLH